MLQLNTTLLPLALASVAWMAQAETLSNAIAEAQKNNAELRVLQASLAASKGGITTARTLPNPELSFAPGIRHTMEQGVAARNDFHGDFASSQLFEWPGKRALKIALAQKNVAVQELAVEAFRFEIAAKVRRAFYELLVAQKITSLRKEQVESAQTFVESSRKRAESGYASDFETMKSQAELIAAQGDLLEAEGKIAAGRVTLNLLLGRSSSAPMELEDTLEGPAARSGSSADYVALAMARNPALGILDLQAASAGLSVRATRLARRPDFAVGPQVEYTRNEQIYGFGVAVSLPFWDQKKGEIQTATAEQRKALAEIEKTRLEITAAVVTASKKLEIARDQLALYTPAFLDRLKGLVARAEQSYAQSATTLLIYLDAKRTYFETLSSYYEALGNAAAQRAELESAVGVPLDLPEPTKGVEK